MANYFISRHPATKAWAKQQQLKIDHWQEHLADISVLKAGDSVYGTLPIQLVAELNEMGVHYVHFSISIAPELRGVELSPGQLADSQPRLEAFKVSRVA